MGDEDNHRNSIDTAHIACPQRACSAIAVRQSSKANCHIHTITITNVLHVLYNICGYTQLIIKHSTTKANACSEREVFGMNVPTFFRPTVCNVM